MNIQTKMERCAKWQSLIEGHEKSGLSQKEFCQVHDLVLSQFVYYRSKLKTKECDRAKAAELFSPIQIKKDKRNSTIEVKIILPNGFQCFVSSLIEYSHLKSMIEVLLSC